MTRNQQVIAVRFLTATSLISAAWSLVALPAISLSTQSQPSLKALTQVALLPIFWCPLLAAVLSALGALYARAATPAAKPRPWSSAARWKALILAAVPILAILLIRAEQERGVLEYELEDADEQVQTLESTVADFESTVEELESQLRDQRGRMLECFSEGLQSNQDTLEILEKSQQALTDLLQCRKDNLELLTQVQICGLRNCLY